MKPERRDTPRIPIAIEAIVSTSKSGYQRTVTRDVSLDGALIATGKQKVGRRNKPVEIALKLPYDGEEKFHRFIAQVVRTAGGGTGLLFEGVDPEGLRGADEFGVFAPAQDAGCQITKILINQDRKTLAETV